MSGVWGAAVVAHRRATRCPRVWLPLCASMAPHLSLVEQVLVLSAFAAGQTASEIFASVAKKRAARSMDMWDMECVAATPEKAPGVLRSALPDHCPTIARP